LTSLAKPKTDIHPPLGRWHKLGANIFSMLVQNLRTNSAEVEEVEMVLTGTLLASTLYRRASVEYSDDRVSLKNTNCYMLDR
jgi:hypothetical protein